MVYYTLNGRSQRVCQRVSWPCDAQPELHLPHPKPSTGDRSSYSCTCAEASPALDMPGSFETMRRPQRLHLPMCPTCRVFSTCTGGMSCTIVLWVSPVSSTSPPQSQCVGMRMIDRVVDPIGHRAVATAMAGLPSTSTPCARPSRPLWTRAAALGALAVTAPPLLVLLHGFREPTPKLLHLLAQSLDHFGVGHTDPLQYMPLMGQLFCERPTTAEQLPSHSLKCLVFFVGASGFEPPTPTVSR
jgi:hypothetical protein